MVPVQQKIVADILSLPHSTHRRHLLIVLRSPKLPALMALEGKANDCGIDKSRSDRLFAFTALADIERRASYTLPTGTAAGA